MPAEVRTCRWLVVTMSAYAMVLHALVMGADVGPHSSSAGLIGTLQQLCAGGVTTSPLGDAPDKHTGRTLSCALCGLGHAAVDIPQVLGVAPPVNIIETVARAGRPASAPRCRGRRCDAQPRASPAFA